MTVSSCTKSHKIDWTPYGVGASIGILSWVAFAIVKEPLGVTTAYSRIASLFALPFIGTDGIAQNAYWKSMPFALDYEVEFLGGLMLGAFVSAFVSGRLRFELIPSVWRSRFGGSVFKRFVSAFFGGMIIMYGARLAGGCTSGHAISGGLQLAVSSWLFLVVMFISGLITSFFIFGRKNEVQK